MCINQPPLHATALGTYIASVAVVLGVREPPVDNLSSKSPLNNFNIQAYKNHKNKNFKIQLYTLLGVLEHLQTVEVSPR